jgi:hypothetical protein
MKTYTQDEFKQLYGEVGLSQVNSTAQPQEEKGTKPSKFFNETKIGSRLKELGSNILETVKDPINVIPQRFAEATPDARQTSLIAGIEKGTPEETKKAFDDAIGFGLSFSGGGNAPKKLGEAAQDIIESNIVSHPKISILENARQKVSNFFSNDIEEKAKTILKETPVEKFDEYVNIADEAIKDPRKLTPFEVVGDRIADAAKQLNQQAKSYAAQKKEIISKAKNGLKDFTKETGQIILDVNRNLKDSKLGKEVISKLKTVRTKLDADNIIDEVQDMLYKGNQDKTIPIGSAEDKFLKGLLGKYNSALKEGLPKAYSNLNTKIANRIKIINSLNRALGEVVDGVSTRGAGLIKQFFSPSGRKAKELFEYIKKETGIDLAQDATLARFTMELFDDPRAKSLLEGVPTSPSGVLQSAIKFVATKTGIGQELQKKLNDNTIRKARGLTQ